jgi:predicted NUDIX family NTP pyrophosphohydrolase
VEPGEAPIDAALREFKEATGASPDLAPVKPARIRQSRDKLLVAFAAEGDLDESAIQSIEFEMEWPPRSGRIERFPEVAKARWMTLAEAREKMLPSQLPLLDALEKKLEG